MSILIQLEFNIDISSFLFYNDNVNYGRGVRYEKIK